MRRTAALLFFLVSTPLWAQSSASAPMTIEAREPSPKATCTAHWSDGLPVMAGISVEFADNSSVFRPSPAQVAVLSDVLNAKLVMIKGRTSTKIPSAKDEALALARAISARNWLVSLGVSPLKIYVNYLSAGDHKEDNSTKDGRAANQRVDIDAYFVDLKH